jgi:hypothetical protein
VEIDVRCKVEPALRSFFETIIKEESVHAKVASAVTRSDICIKIGKLSGFATTYVLSACRKDY